MHVTHLRTKAAAVVSLLAAAAVIWALSANAKTPAAHAAAPSGVTPDAATAAAVPEFDQRPTKTDGLPSFLVSGPQAFDDIAFDTTRTLGTKDGVNYWTALNRAGETCLIALLPGKGQFASMSCAAGEQLWENGLSLQFADDTHAVRAHLVPDAVNSKPAGTTAVGDQLLVGSSEKPSKAVTLDVPDRAGTKYGADELTLPALEPLAKGAP